MTSTVAAAPDSPTPTIASPPPPVLISSRPGRLLSVTGRLDGAGVARLRGQLWAAMEGETAFVALDLSAVTDCDVRLFAVLAEIHAALRTRAGWMRLVGLSPAVLAALDTAPIPEILLVYRTSDRAPGSGVDQTTPEAVGR